MTVEMQQAIIYLGTNGLLLDVPVKEIREFELNFLETMNANHKDVLKSLKEGKIDDDVINTLEKVAKDMTGKYRSAAKSDKEDEGTESTEEVETKEATEEASEK